MEPSLVPGVDSPAIVITTAVGLSLASVALVLRLYVRLAINNFFGYDDWALIAAWLGLVALSGLQIAYGVTVEGDGINTSVDKITLITEWHTFVYALHQALLKGALAAFYLRVLQERWQRILVLASTTIFAFYNTGIGFVLLFQCGDPADVESTNCLPTDPLLTMIYVQAGMNVFMDGFLTLLPISIFFRTQMSTRARLSVGLLMILGAIASTFSVARIPFMDTSAGNFATLTKLMILSYYENSVAQVGIAAVALRPLFRRILEVDTDQTPSIERAGSFASQNSKMDYHDPNTEAALEVQTLDIADHAAGLKKKDFQ